MIPPGCPGQLQPKLMALHQLIAARCQRLMKLVVLTKLVVLMKLVVLHNKQIKNAAHYHVSSVNAHSDFQAPCKTAAKILQKYKSLKDITGKS